ncbi:MAG TPA: PIN domain-containing protein, partial [Cellvibrionaceae bacterium]|nr:PIN domain-containing protein [Cellvibrionaceae bacterium]
MGSHYVLIDYENVQPDNLAQLTDPAFRVLVFVGDKQIKIAFELAAAMQALGARAEYVKIEGNGLNALDFHIAFYIGQLATSDKHSQFHIISKDTGFDPLIRHLKHKHIQIERREELTALLKPKPQTVKTPQPAAQAAAPAPPATNPVAKVFAYLRIDTNPRPKTRTSLLNFLNSHLKQQFDKNALNTLVDELIDRKI